MSEPKVGMRYGSYLTMGKNYEKKADGARVDAHTVPVGSSYDKKQVFRTTYYDKKGDDIACSSLETYGKEQKSTFATDEFIYSGKGSLDDADIKYTRIDGKNSYAIDENGNGVVDANEIKRH
jgi:hypothetical protein